MSDTTNDIDALLRDLTPANGWRVSIGQPDAPRYHAALTALVAERDALKQRVAELEAQLPADRDRELRERDDAMALWMEEVTNSLCLALSYCGAGRGELGTRCDAALAAMRKEDSNGK